jgi:urease accessory protein
MSVLERFRALPTAEAVLRLDALPPPASGYSRDTITLGWEDRLRTRGRRMTDRGVEFGTVLPRGTILRDGDCVVVEALRLVVAVIERPEPVLVVRPASPTECGLFGYQIGNSHQPLMLTDHEMICPDYPGMEQILDQHGIRFTRAFRPFTPVGSMVDHGSGIGQH